MRYIQAATIQSKYKEYRPYADENTVARKMRNANCADTEWKNTINTFLIASVRKTDFHYII